MLIVEIVELFIRVDLSNSNSSHKKLKTSVSTPLLAMQSENAISCNTEFGRTYKQRLNGSKAS